jgi:hypothetical protein
MIVEQIGLGNAGIAARLTPSVHPRKSGQSFNTREALRTRTYAHAHVRGSLSQSKKGGGWAG